MATRTKLLVVLGATGTGKSRLAVELCQRLGGEAVNADAMQCYAGLPIATNKATDAERAGVPHHLLGFSDPLAAPDAQLNVHRWVARADAAIADIAARGSLPVVVGGTHYYVEALVWRRLVGCELHAPPPAFAADVPTAELYAQLQAADPVMASRVCESDRRKIARSLQVHAQTGRRHSELLAEQRTAPAEPRYDALFLWVDCDDWDALSARLDARIDEMLARGLLAEIAEFKAAATSAGQTSFERGIHQAIGVREFWPICGTAAAEEEDPAALAAATDAMKRNTRKYARQQVRWIRNRLERGGVRLVRLALGADTSRWNVDVLEPALLSARAFLAETAVPGVSTGAAAAAAAASAVPGSYSVGQWQNRVCDLCGGRVLHGEHEWAAHIKSNHHKAMKRQQRRRQQQQHSQVAPSACDTDTSSKRQ